MARICASQNRDIVSALILKSFSARSVAEQRLIYEQSRQLPKLGLQCGGRKFRFKQYRKKAWLCGSEGKQNLFCCPYLLSRLGLSATCTVTGYKSLIVKSMRLLSGTSERKKREKPSIYLSLRGLTRYFRDREGRRSSIPTRRLYRLNAHNVIPLA